MAGESGWRKVDELVSRDGTKCHIRVSTATGQFWALVERKREGYGYPEKVFDEKGSDINEVREKAKKFLEDSINLNWEPVILITRPEEPGNRRRWSGHSEDSIHLEYERFFRATTKEGPTLWRDFKPIVEEAEPKKPRGLTQYEWNQRLEGTSEEMKENATKGEPGDYCKEPYRATASGSEDGVLLPYTPEKWSALRGITFAIRQVKAKLRENLELSRAPGFLDAVAARGAAALLPAPKAAQDPEVEG